VAAQAINKYAVYLDAYILTSPMSSIRDLIQHHLKNYLDILPEDWLEQNSFKSIEALKNIRLPAIIFHGTKDKIVPYEQGLELYNNLKYDSIADFITLEGENHTSIFQSSKMWEEAKSFISIHNP